MMGAFSFAWIFAGQRIHHVVFEVDEGTSIYGNVLNHVERLRKAFAPERVEIEVVCHGEGIAMLFPSEKIAKRMSADARVGIVFAACRNTMNARHLQPKDLYPFAKVVPSGVAEVVRKQEAGWAYLK